jgi:hypothetical protein
MLILQEVNKDLSMVELQKRQPFIHKTNFIVISI